MVLVVMHPLCSEIHSEIWAVFCLLLTVSSDYAQPITGMWLKCWQVTWPVIGWAQPELTLSKRQKNGPWAALVFTTGSPHYCTSCIPWLDYHHWYQSSIVTLRPRQNGRHVSDDIFKCIFLNENFWISHKIWLKFVPKVWINKIPALVQIMAWHRPGDKPLSEPMMV